MLKLIFWLLLVANTILFAFRMGYLGSLTTSKTESERLEKQLNVNKIKVITSEKKASASTPPSQAAAASSAVAPSPGLTPPPPAPVASKEVSKEAPKEAVARKLMPCTEVGEFADGNADKFESRLAKLVSDDRRVRRIKQKGGTYMVHIPPQSNKANADKKAQELRELGISNFFIIKDNSPMRWGISLGVFKSEDLAKKHLAALKKKGVRSARISARGAGEKRVTFVLRDMDDESLHALEKIMVDFPEQKSRECGKS